MQALAQGMDVSKWQGEIDWAKVKESGVQFAVLRAYAGKPDPMFEKHYAAAKAAGIPVGAYLYSYADTPEKAQAEAKTLLTLLEGKQLEYPVYFDIEDKVQTALAKEKIESLTKAFCDALEEAGYFVGIYSYKSFLEQNFSAGMLTRYAVWVAHTGVSSTTYRYPYGMWQYSHTGQIAGISGDVDLNFAYVDYPSLIKNGGKNGWKTAEEKPSAGEAVVWDYQYDSEIKALQNILNDKGASLALDGKAGNKTYAAVRRYTIRQGDKGILTAWVQKRLNNLGFSCGSADGIAGEKTMAGIAAFQKAHGLGVGYLGGTDWYFLIR